MTRLALLLAVLGALVCAPSAQAGWQTQRATAIADIAWNHPCDNLHVEWQDQTYAGDSAWSATNGHCAAIINRSNGPLEFEELCSLVIHETGHLAGYHDPTNTTDPAHSANPRSVMSAETNFVHSVQTVDKRTESHWTGVDKRCLNRGRPFLTRHDYF